MSMGATAEENRTLRDHKGNKPLYHLFDKKSDALLGV